MMDGLYPKVIIPMISSPIMGFVGGFIIMGVLFLLIRPLRHQLVNALFGKLQLVGIVGLWLCPAADDSGDALNSDPAKLSLILLCFC